LLSTLPLTFITIVEKGSITKAADSLNLAKSAVSQNLKRLEQQLGVKLAARTTRRLSLTPAGERYYKRCKEIIALSHLASTEMEDFGAQPAGTITITAPHAFIAPVLAPAMTQVIKQYPKLKPIVIADDRRLDLIAQGIDVSISVGHLPDSNLKARRVGVLRDILCVSPKLLTEKPTEEAAILAWIQSLPYIAHSRESLMIKHEFVSEYAKKMIDLHFKPTFKSNTVEALANFAREGAGVALLPELAIAEDLKSGRLVHLLPEYSLKPLPIYAVHVYDTLPPPSVLEVIKAIESKLR